MNLHIDAWRRGILPHSFQTAVFLESIKRLAILAGVLLACANASAATPLPSADEIIARHCAARGGVDRLRALHSIVSYGTYREAGDDQSKPDSVMALMRPYYKLVGDPDHPSKDFSEGWDGAAWEFYGDPGIVLRTVGAASAATRHHASLDGPLLDYRLHGSDVSLQGLDAVSGHPAYRLRVRMSDGSEEDELVDAENWMLVGQRRVAKIHAFGADVATETRFSDFRPVDGITFAFRTQEVEIASGKVLNESVTSKMVLDRTLDPLSFSPPIFQRTELQRFLELLFGERDDAQAVLWTYADFRRGHPDVETDVGIQVIGYQMLKMGEPAASVALLEQNVRDYPASSGAAFGLGRAYNAVNRVADSRTQLDNALLLDPKNERARKLLQQIASSR
jgi:hypothetical protein